MAGDKPYPEVPIGNKNHSNAAVVIIGAGISGMCTAIDLVKRSNCRNFVILEKSAGLGGTWHDNKYPGCKAMKLRSYDRRCMTNCDLFEYGLLRCLVHALFL